MKITEISASDQLLAFRQEQELFIEPSFDTIAAYQDHAAMMHYSATEESDVELKPEGVLLVDSGGQYYEGTTDITRTFVLGPISERMPSALYDGAAFHDPSGTGALPVWLPRHEPGHLGTRAAVGSGSGL